MRTLTPRDPVNTMLNRIERWPSKASQETHCSNCAHALVTGEWPAVVAHCEEDHGSLQMDYGRLIRPGAPGFVNAHQCPDFESMGPLDL